jgi:L-iditol 2-dehydrogenase
MTALPQTTTAVVLHAIDDIRLDTRPVAKPGPYDALIAVKSVGICGSDVHYWKHGRIGPFILNSPMVLGHESSGQVVAVGEKVTHLKAGDRVTMEPGVPCRQCNSCKIGRYNLCPDVVFMATPPYDGSLSNYIVHPADFCFKLPDHVSFDEGAMCEPLSVGVHAVSRAKVSVGQTVLITGAGPIGLMCLMAAKAAGAGITIITDIKQERLDVAKSLGATHTIDTTKVPDVVSQVVSLVGPQAVDTSIECSGATVAIHAAIKATRNGGVVVLVGMGAPEISLPLVDAAVREVDLIGVFRYANTYPKALALIASGKVDVKSLITHHFNYKESVDAFNVARVGADKDNKMAIKVIINVE